MIAFIPSLSWPEMFLLLVFGLLLYGRNLPEAGRSLGRVVAQLKRSFYDFKDQIDREGELRDVKKAIQDTAREVKNVARVPTAIANPGDALRELTLETMSSPLPNEDPDEAPSAAQNGKPVHRNTERIDGSLGNEIAADEPAFPDATDTDDADGQLADDQQPGQSKTKKP